MESSGRQGLSNVDNETADIGRGKGHTTNKRRNWLAGLSAVAILLSGGLYQAGAPLAQAANVQLQSINVTVAADGTNDGPNGQVMVNGVALDHVGGMDDDHNGLIATQDTVAYRITAYYAAGTTAADTLSLVGTLPTGAVWQSTSYSADSCTVSGAGYNNTSAFTCKWAGDGNTEKVFTWYAMPQSGPFKNGDSLQATFKDGNGGTVIVTSPALTVVSAPAITIGTVDNPSQSGGVVTYEGAKGFQVMLRIYLKTPTGDSRGLEGTKATTFVVSVPDKAIFTGTNGAQPDGMGGDIYVNLGALNVSAYTPSSITTTVIVFIPYSELTADVPYTVQMQVKNFDPDGLSGQSNYGAGYTPGQVPGTGCIERNAGDNCSSPTVTYLTTVQMQQKFVYGQQLGSTSTIMTTSNFSHPEASGMPRVVPGGAFVPMLEFMNDPISGGDMVGASSCVTWDSSLATLKGSARVGGVAQLANGLSAYNDFGTLLAGNVVPLDDATNPSYTLQYASVPGLTPGSFDCWATSGGVTWMNTLPTDTSSVNAVRLKMNISLAPSDAVGLALPMQRTLTVPTVTDAETGTPQIWFYNSQSWDGNTTAVKSSGWVGADDAQVRATTTAAPATSSAGKSATFTVTPTIFGPPLDNTSTTAVNTQLVLSFDSACVDVSAAVAALETTYGSSAVSFTTGAGTAACAAGTTSPNYTDGPTITISLGDVTAPGSARQDHITSGLDNISANETYIGSPISIPVFFSTLSPNSTVHMTTVIQSDSDTSAVMINTGVSGLTPGTTDADRISWAIVTLNTAEGFTVEKLVSTNSAGLVNPGETFSYTLYAANTMLGDYGVTSLVDVLPFPGDPRLNGQTDGLVGTDGLQLVSASGVMYDAVNDQDVDLDVYCSSADPAAAYNDLAGDASTAGDYAGENSLFNWQLCSSLSSLGQVTAVKFATPDLFVSKASITATVTVKAPALSIGGHIVNDMAYLAPAPPASRGVTPNEETKGIVLEPAELAATSAGLAGTVFQDTDFTSDLGAADLVWPEAGWVMLEDATTSQPLLNLADCDTAGVDPADYATACQPYLVQVQSDGTFEFPLIPAGHYKAVLVDSNNVTDLAAGIVPLTSVTPVDADLWQMAIQTDGTNTVTNPVIVEQGKTADENTAADVLYQEIIAAPSLVDDPDDPAAGVVSSQGSLTIDVLANDTVYETEQTISPVIPAGTQTITLPSASENGGKVELVAATDTTTRAATSYQVKYTPAAGFTGTDSFTYEWCNVYEECGTAIVTLTVAGLPTLTTTADQTILEGSSITFDNQFIVDDTLLPDGVTQAVTVSGCVIDDPIPGGATIDETTGAVTFDSSVSGPGTFAINITCTDSLEKTATGTNTVTVLYGEITIDKSGDLTTSGNDKVDDTITWQFTVENTGTADLTGVTINDTLTDGVLGDITCGDDKTPNGEVTLAAHESIKCTATSAITLEQKNAGVADNTATVSATAVDPQDANNTSVTVKSGESSWTVPLSWNAKVNVQKDASITTDLNNNGKADEGDQITFVITVTNIGDVSVYGITVTDSMSDLTLTCGDQTNGAIKVDPDKSVVCTTDAYTVTAADAAAGKVVNTATISGKPGSESSTPSPSQRGGGGVTGDSEVTVTIEAPAPQAPTGGQLASGSWLWLGGIAPLLAGAVLLLRRRRQVGGAA